MNVNNEIIIHPQRLSVGAKQERLLETCRRKLYARKSLKLLLVYSVTLDYMVTFITLARPKPAVFVWPDDSVASVVQLEAVMFKGLILNHCSIFGEGNGSLSAPGWSYSLSDLSLGVFNPLMWVYWDASDVWDDNSPAPLEEIGIYLFLPFVFASWLHQ